MPLFRLENVLLGAAIITILLGAIQIGRELKRRRRAECALHEALASVEQQVAEVKRREQQIRQITEHDLHLALAERAVALDRAEEARRLAEEASDLKDEFLATASHELRTPLNAIVGWVHVLQSGALAEEEQRKHAVDAIERNARVQTRLIEDLLDVSRMIQGRLSLTVAPLDIRTVVDAAIDTVKPAAAAKQIAINVKGGLEPIIVIGDDNRLKQIVWNLLANAVKYTAKGGTIEVEAERTGGRAAVRVKDSGEGIAAEFLPYVFEPFRQGASRTMRSGLGLGLAIVRRLVDLHGGRIAASSPGVGQGSEFTLSLPMAQGSAIRPQAPH
jgi:signal transduction histidine kinase